jgi:glycosyltransferase involved in cell wall biosynthesis
MGSDIFMDYEPVRQCLNGLIARLVVKRAGAIICKSNGMRRKIKRQAGVYVVPNGIDLELFRPLDQQQCRKKVGWSDARKYIVFVGDPIIPEKKYSLALESIAHLNNAEAEFRVIKDLPQEALPQYYNAADVLLMTSDYEGSPNVIKEALACNLPIVSTDVGDVAERLAGVRQCYVATGTKDDLAAKIADVLHNGGRSNGREHVLDLDLSSIARRLLVLYTDVLGSV